MRGFFAAALLFAMTACGSGAGERPDGWYLIVDGEAVGEPIVTVADFESLKLDSFPGEDGVMCQIVGRLKDDKVSVWADATESAVGGTIGFVYDGRILSSPQVMGRIESGSFAISLPSGESADCDMENIYRGLLEEMGIVGESAAETVPPYAGTYRGTIPAADAPGINVTLVLGNDGSSFEMTMEYIDRNASFDSAGRYELKGNTIVLTADDGEKTLFHLEDGRLRMLDIEGNVIDGVLADNYILTKE